MNSLQQLAELSPESIAEAHKSGLISDRELILLVNTIERERCMNDLFYLAHDVLGYTDLTESIHRPLCQLVESVNPLIIQLSKRLQTSSPQSTSHLRPVDTSVQLMEKHADNMAEWFGYEARGIDGVSGPNQFGGVGGGMSILTSTQNLQKNFIENFYLPNNNSINKLLESKIIEFNPEARTRLFLLFRGAFKSTIITIAHTIQLMLIWPDIRILIASHKKEGGSQKFLGSIKDHFIRNDRFRKLFPEFCPKPNSQGQMEWGTSEQVTLPNRSATAIYPEATIEIAGNTTDVTGRHYNYLKIDDIVTRESVTNETMLEKTEEFNALLTFLFDQPEWGLSDYAGTCYHFSDLYSQLRNSPQITKFILPIWDENKNPTIPERFTKEGIEAIRNHPSQTSYQFSCQYLLNPVPTDDQTFRPEYWNKSGFYYDKLPKDLKVYVLVDPANKQRKDSDYTALMTIGIDSSGDLWLIDIIRDKLTLDQRAKLVCDILIKHSIHILHYESVGFQSSDIKAIKEMGTLKDWYINVVEVKASRQSKEDRIRGLQYFYEQAKVHWPKRYSYFSKYHNRNYDMVEVLRREMWMFPSCEKDDLCDVHSFILRTAMIKSSDYKPKDSSDDAFTWWKKQVAKKQPWQPINGGTKGWSGLPSQKSFR